MYKKTVSRIMLILLLISMLFSSVNIKTAKTEPRTIIVPDDYPTIQEAINMANDGDAVFVRTGIYPENIVLNKSVRLIGEDKNNTIIDGMQKGSGITVTVSNALIKGFTITNNTLPSGPITEIYAGIYLKGVTGCVITDNILRDNIENIQLEFSHHNNITKNIIINDLINPDAPCRGRGIGVELYCSHNNNILENVFIGDGLVVDGSYENIVEDNLVNGKPLLYLEEKSGISIDNNAGQIIVVRCHNISIINQNISNTDNAIQLIEVNNTKIIDCALANNDIGISLSCASHNMICKSNITKNRVGICCFPTSPMVENNIICENNVTENCCGIHIEFSNNNFISRNNVRKSNCYGFWIWGSNNNTVAGNNITDNFVGVFYCCANNTYYHNNFIDNQHQVHDYAWSVPDIPEISINVWDDGYPSGGNYWSDYAGEDLYSGPYQNETGSDGIGDSPYIIDTNNVDRYPLMQEWPSIHNVAVLNVSFHQPVIRGNIIDVNATVMNNGHFEESFNATLIIDSYVVKKKTPADVQPGETCTLSFVWNTTDFPKGDYLIEVRIDPVENETYLKDNSAYRYVTVYEHDVAVTNLTVSRMLIMQGHTVKINVTVTNQGDFEETFNVEVYANMSQIGIQEITLSNGTSVTITFTWNTTNFAKGNYTLSAFAWPVQSEIDTEGNTYVTGIVWVKWPYDVTHDNYCGIDDIVAVAEHFGAIPGDPNWNPIYDITCDDYVGIDDIVEMADHFGQTDP